MGKSALLFGSPESVHIQRFITLLLSEEEGFDKLVVFKNSASHKMSDRDIAFYESRGIDILCCDPKQYGNRYLNAALNYLRGQRLLKKYLRKHKQFDYCLVHFCSWQRVMWTAATRKFYKQIVPVFYGGDVLRNKHLDTYIYRHFLNISSHIVMPNENAYNVFREKTSDKYASKTHTIQFPNGVCERMLSQKDTIIPAEARKLFNLPQDKKIVLCGHTATRAERYEEMICELEKCSAETINSCCFVFFMTYAPDDYRRYQAEIEERLSATKLQYIILKEFLSQEDMVKLHYAADIHITTIKTDAFSCFLQEEMLAGNILLYGKWLNYYEIENDQYFTFPLESFGDISRVMDEVAANYEEYAKQSQKNIAGLINLKSNTSIKDSWRTKVFAE